MKPPFKANYDADSDVLYIAGSDNRPAVAQEHPIYGEAVLLRFAVDNNELVGVTLLDTGFKKRGEPIDWTKTIETKPVSHVGVYDESK